MTRIEEKELLRTLISLSAGKVQPLRRSEEPAAGSVTTVNPNDVFEFNDAFTHKLYKIKINTVQIKETSEENQATTDKVFQDRQYQVHIGDTSGAHHAYEYRYGMASSMFFF